MADSYAKVLFDFATTEPGEISLYAGDVVRIVDVVNDSWLCGECNGRTGRFPQNFVEPINIPAIENGQRVFVATRTFQAEIQEDLHITTGDIVVGLEAIDQNWWKGKKGWKTGIFPLTHVYQLLPHQDEPCDDIDSSNNNCFQDNKPTTATYNGNAYDTQQNDDTINHPVTSQYVAVCRATMDLAAQMDDELGFCVGDKIFVTEVIDADFAVGVCGNSSGQFPLGFVEVLEGSVACAAAKQIEKKSKFRWWEEDKGRGSGTIDGGDAVAAEGEKSGYKSDLLRKKSTDASVLIQSKASSMVSNSNTSNRQSSYSYTSENMSSHDVAVTAYGKTLFPFVAENSNELTFFDNEIVTLLRHVDDQWIEGEIDGRKGIFPASYVEVIVDCPWDEQPTKSTAVDINQKVEVQEEETVAPPESVEEMLPEDTYALVMYDFHGDGVQTLSIKEGDTVTLISQVDTHWYKARHDNGSIGLCPVQYVQKVSAEPPTSPAASVESAGEVESNNNLKRGSKNNVDESVHVLTKAEELDNADAGDCKSSMEQQVPGLTRKDSGKVKPKIAAKPNYKPKPAIKPKPKTTLAKSGSVLGSSLESSDNMSSAPGSKQGSTSEDIDNLQTYPGANIAQETVLCSVAALKHKPPIINPSKPSDPDLHLNAIVSNEMTATRQQLTRSISPALTSPRHSYTSSDAADTIDMAKPQRIVPSPRASSNYDAIRELQNEHSSSDQLSKPKTGRRPPRPAVPMLPKTREQPLGPRPIPRRKAPPRPGHVPDKSTKRPPRPAAITNKYKGQEGNLMQFSPGSPQSNSVFYENDENTAVIADLDARIKGIEDDIEKYEKQCAELTQMLSVVDGEDTEGNKEIDETIEFYTANIRGLSEEKQQLQANLFTLAPSRAQQEADRVSAAEQAERERQQQEELRIKAEEQRKVDIQRRHDTRTKVIEELIQTEADYLQALQLCMNTLLSPQYSKCAGFDYELILGNIDEVADVSQRLLLMLEAATNGKEFDEQILGQSFIDLKEDMKKVYAPYCRNHDEAQVLLTKYEEVPEMQDFLHNLVETMREERSVFDLGAILIKPVQRILKYPLLLNELLKSTEDDHTDKAVLLTAINAMTDVAAAINEYKRRKDLVLKYKRESDSKLSDKIAKLNMHSTKKKLIRISQRMVGIQTVDEEFERLEKQFICLDKSIKTLTKDVTLYLEHLQESCSAQETVANDISDYYGERNTDTQVHQYCTVHNTIATSIHALFKQEVTDLVLGPLHKLTQLTPGPFKVIRKRYDKLLDYESLQSKAKSAARDPEQLKTIEKELQTAKNNYTALNAQLLDELPQLISLGTCVLRDATTRLILAQKKFYSESLDEIYKLLGLQFVLSDPSTNLVSAFTFAHEASVEKLSDLSFAGKSFNSRLEDKKGTVRGKRLSTIAEPQRQPLLSDSDATAPTLCTQSDSQRLYVRGCYPPNKLYRVIHDQPSQLMMDLPIKAGCIVGVIKEGDPMGNKDRWFIDTGADKGFVSRHVLQLAIEQPSPSASPTPMAMLAGASTNTGAAGGGGGEKGVGTRAGGRGSTEATTAGVQGRDLLQFSPPHSPQLLPGQQSRPSSQRDSLSPTPDMILHGSRTSLTFEGTTTPTNTTPTVTPRVTPTPALRVTQTGNSAGTSSPTAVVSDHLLYQAVYAFTARSDIEVSLQDGEMIEVIEQQDLDGNKEWWLVQNTAGATGYVPANYLYALK